jgi:hypothetical protein
MPGELAGWTVARGGDLRIVMHLLRERLRAWSRA